MLSFTTTPQDEQKRTVTTERPWLSFLQRSFRMFSSSRAVLRLQIARR
jgi:hypothetical protein